MSIMKSRWLVSVPLAAAALALTACGDLSYCVQCVRGQVDVMSRSRPIEELLLDPQVPDAERVKLAKVMDIRNFAIDELGLPDNDSYRIYADLGRPYVVWNVVAAPEFSLAPKQWCFPVVGCVSYRGYFDAGSAEAMGETLAAEGYDVDVYGVKAYSTLSWFDDPVLNTFLDGADTQLASLIFHELAHQVAYAPDDCSFNEAFAKTVEMEGLRRWLRDHADEAKWQEYLDRDRRGKDFLAILNQAKDQLDDLYARPGEIEAKRLAKRAVLARAEQELRDMGQHWPDPAALEDWLAPGLNNARLASIATYQDWVPAFQTLLQSYDGDLPAFYAEVVRLTKLSAVDRVARLSEFGRIASAAACVDPSLEVYE